MMIKIKQHRIHYHVFMCLYSVQKAVTIHRHDTPFTDLNKQKKCAEKGKKKMVWIRFFSEPRVVRTYYTILMISHDPRVNESL